MSKIDEELKKLKMRNEGKRIKLRYQRNTKTGSISMYLDLSDQQRSREFLRIILQGKDETFKADKEKLKLAINMRDQRENEFLSSKTGFQLDNQRVDFLTYFRMLSEHPGKHESYKHSFMKFQQFCKGKVVYFDQIDRRYCEQFADFLINDDIKSSTANLYFKKFVATLNHAIKNEIIDIPLWDDEKTRAFITSRIEDIRQAMQFPDDFIPPCNATERWQSESQYAVYKTDGKRALRVFPTMQEAEDFVQSHKDADNLSIVTREDTPKRCMNYCAVNQFCHYYRDVLALPIHNTA